MTILILSGIDNTNLEQHTLSKWFHVSLIGVYIFSFSWTTYKNILPLAQLHLHMVWSLIFNFETDCHGIFVFLDERICSVTKFISTSEKWPDLSQLGEHLLYFYTLMYIDYNISRSFKWYAAQRKLSCILLVIIFIYFIWTVPARVRASSS